MQKNTGVQPCPTKTKPLTSTTNKSNGVLVGTVLKFGGHDARALQHRLGQATKRLAVWASLILSKWLPLTQRKKALETSIGTWPLTKAPQNKAKSWAARVAARVKGVHRSPCEDMATFWRHLHREGDKSLTKSDVDPQTDSRDTSQE